MSAPAVLIVEDEAIVALDLQATLQELGYDAFAVASSAEEAIAAATARCPDLVLMDIRIKGQRDGIETAEILKGRFTIPVVYLTSHADHGTIERAKKTEPHGYLQKPVRGAELRSAIEVALYKYESEKRARERERWFETTLKSIADAVIAVDKDGNVAFMNETAADLTGVDVSAAVGQKVRDVLRLRAERDLPVLEALERRAAVALLRGELENRRDGTRRTITDSAAPVIDDGNLLGAVMVFRDVTAAEELERRLEQTSRLTSLGTLAAGVAHEVNNPLGAVIANAQYVGEALASGAVGTAAERAVWRDAIADIASAGARIGRIVSDLRAFSRPVNEEPGAVDLARCVDWATRTTRHELKDRARLVVEPGRVSPVRGDETRLGQVLVNLVINAAQAIAPGAADENVVRVACVEAGDDVVLSVSDTGSGMSEDVQRRVFEPFFTTKEVGVGTGLGLSICHGIVSALGGRIDIDSAVGRGTTLRVTLPKAKTKTSPTKKQAPAPLPSPTPRWRVLVIDDEPLVSRTVQRVLRRHDVVVCDSGEAALAHLATDAAFDVVLCDVNMPSMSGEQLYEALRGRFPLMAERLLFLSGGMHAPRMGAFLRASGLRQLQKPFDVDALLGAVEDAVARGRRQTNSSDPLHPTA